MLNQTYPDGSRVTYTTTASTQQPLTSTQNATGGAAAVLVGNDAENFGYIYMHLYRLGSLRYITQIYADVISTGF